MIVVLAGCAGNQQMLEDFIAGGETTDGTTTDGSATDGSATGGSDAGAGDPAPTTDVSHAFSTYPVVMPGGAVASTLGTRSLLTETTGFGSGTLGLSARATTEGRSRAALFTAQIFPVLHLQETFGASLERPVLDAWQDGWTGLGQTIAIIDDFEQATLPVYVTAIADRQFDVEVESPDPITGEPIIEVETYDFPNVVHKITYDLTHGDVVTLLAGGNYNQTSLNLGLGVAVTQFSQGGCSIAGCPIEDESQLNEAFGDTAAAASFVSVAGVAKQALMVRNDVDLSAAQDPTGSMRAIYGHIDNSHDFSAVNVSIANNINTVGMTYDQLRAMFSGEEIEKTTDAVISVAAGNTGAPCGTTDLNGCNALAVLLANLDQTRESTIVVGATERTTGIAITDDATTESIAAYSARAGALKDRFLLAPGDSGFLVRSAADVPSDSTFLTAPVSLAEGTLGPQMIRGTSFAAPRVTGAAAILRQKFPNLSGAQAASVLLLTASKDINNDGLDDFSGVSDTFGHGKLDLGAALSPFGALNGP